MAGYSLCNTSWLSHKVSFSIYTSQITFSSLIVASKIPSDPKALGLHKMCNKYMLIAWLHLLRDALTALNDVNLISLSANLIWFEHHTHMHAYHWAQPSVLLERSIIKSLVFEESLKSLIWRMNTVAHHYKQKYIYSLSQQRILTLTHLKIGKQRATHNHITPTAPQHFETLVHQKFISQMTENLEE